MIFDSPPSLTSEWHLGQITPTKTGKCIPSLVCRAGPGSSLIFSPQVQVAKRYSTLAARTTFLGRDGKGITLAIFFFLSAIFNLFANQNDSTV
jgi:hypothetical protein